jgi:UDP-N-acetyl-D-mannosaminuronic acid transferase (WecB/TagA/CpsF family)
MIRALDDFDIHLFHYFRHRAAEHRALIAAIGVELQQEWIHAEHGRHDQRAAIAILNVGGVHDGVDQQALRVDENVPLLALDLLSRVVTRPIDRTPPFSALFTLWLSITAAVGLAALETASRHFT